MPYKVNCAVISVLWSDWRDIACPIPQGQIGTHSCKWSRFLKSLEGNNISKGSLHGRFLETHWKELLRPKMQSSLDRIKMYFFLLALAGHGEGLIAYFTDSSFLKICFNNLFHLKVIYPCGAMVHLFIHPPIHSFIYLPTNIYWASAKYA